MEHKIEPASSGRAKCRGCGQKIEKGDIRFGEVLPNPFSDGNTMTHWFHLWCAAMKRPDPSLETIDSDHVSSNEAEELRGIARKGLAHRRVPRIDGAGRAPTARARCRHCREMIDKYTVRVKLVFYEEGMFNPAGFIHLTCSADYFETVDIVDRLMHFSSDLTNDDRESIEKVLGD